HLLSCQVRGVAVGRASGRTLTAPQITAHNTFDEPERVRPRALEEVQAAPDGLALRLPARSVSVVEIEQPNAAAAAMPAQAGG
ncbi:MAG: alpha-L-arabinofuranosidase C-terminal domain-containing protein, partial [Candidatus Latescibacterota bacterium]